LSGVGSTALRERHFIATGANNTITGNWIGTDRFGNDLGINGDGIQINSRNNTISSNVVSGNSNDGIEIGSSGTGNLVIGNYIGTNSTGTALLTPANTGNSGGGLNILGGSNTIGGTSAAERNVIAGNGWGISITGASGNVVQGNYIGTNASGTLGLANTIEGVRIWYLRGRDGLPSAGSSQAQATSLRPTRWASSSLARRLPATSSKAI
jgi:parallel beta-helix repeat protein